MRVVALVITLLLSSLCVLARPFIGFDLTIGKTFCFSDELIANRVYTGHVDIVSAPSQLHFWIHNANNKILYIENDAIANHQFSFITDTDGVYSYCFLALMRKDGPYIPLNTYRRIYFSVDAKNAYLDLYNNEVFDPLEAEFDRVSTLLNTLSDRIEDQMYLKELHSDVTDSLNTTVAWLSFSSMMIFLVLSVFQVFYMQKYLKACVFVCDDMGEITAFL